MDIISYAIGVQLGNKGENVVLKTVTCASVLLSTNEGLYPHFEK